MLELSPAALPPVGATDRRVVVRATGPEKPVYPGFQHRFNGVGRVDGITAEEVVIDDRLFKLAKKVTFNMPGRYDVSRARVGKGNIVGFMLNARKEVDSIWIME
jgi:hypothetical protein